MTAVPCCICGRIGEWNLLDQRCDVCMADIAACLGTVPLVITGNPGQRARDEKCQSGSRSDSADIMRWGNMVAWTIWTVVLLGVGFAAGWFMGEWNAGGER